MPLLMTPSLESSVERSVRKLARERRRRLLRKAGAMARECVSQKLVELVVQTRGVGDGLPKIPSDHKRGVGRLRIDCVS